MTITGAEIVVETLIAQGVEVVFGIPGGQALSVYDALQARSERILHVLTAHEQGACHAADGYARASGRVGVCLSTSGPGATNLVTGIACAYMDASPVVAITVNVPGSQLGTDGFQEIDIFGVTTPITKHNYIVKRIDDLARTLEDAFRVARSGCAGPVLVDIARDVCQERAEYTKMSPAPARVPRTDTSALETCALALARAQKPCILAGGGVIASGAAEELRALSERLRAPVACTLMGLGAFPCDHPLFLGMAGIHGTRTAKRALTACDCLLAVGTRFSERVTGAGLPAKAKILHIDINDAQIGKNVPVDVGACADAKEALAYLAQAMPQRTGEAWLAADRQRPARAPSLSPQCVLETLAELTGDERVILCTDVGQHQIWAARYFGARRPRALLTSGGLGAMGFGLPAAIGAKAAFPRDRVILITGDGSFRMGFGELATARASGLDVFVLILDNSALGMVRQWQGARYGGRFSQSDLSDTVDYARLARAFSCAGLRVRSAGKLRDTLARALALPGTVVVDCKISKDARVQTQSARARSAQ